MYISKKDRELIKQKFGGKCAYSGTELEPDWQVEHIKPVVRNLLTNTPMFKDAHNIENMGETQETIVTDDKNLFDGDCTIEKAQKFLDEKYPNHLVLSVRKQLK